MAAINKLRAAGAIMVAMLALLDGAIAGGAIADPAALAIVGARVYTSPGAAPIDDGVVVVQDGKIVSVGKRSVISVPETARVIDAQGAVLTAGFWNSHVHIMTDDLLNASTAKP